MVNRLIAFTWSAHILIKFSNLNGFYFCIDEDGITTSMLTQT